MMAHLGALAGTQELDPNSDYSYAIYVGVMTAYICCRYENQKGDVGQWGPVVSAVIP
jgi:hypothetical protein